MSTRYLAQFVWPTDDGHGSSPNTAAFSGTTIDWAHNRVFLWNGTSIRGYSIGTFQTFEPYASAFWPTNVLETVMGCRTTPDGYVLVGFSDASTTYKLDPITLASVAQLGPGSYPHGIAGNNAYDGAMGCITVNGVPYVLIKEVLFGNGGVVRTDTLTAAGFYAQVGTGWFGECIVCGGASGASSGSFFVIDSAQPVTQHLNLHKITVLAGAENWNISSWPTQNPDISMATLIQFGPTDIDATWTQLTAASIGYDSKNNIVIVQFSNGGAAERYVGLNGNTGAIVWNIQPFGASGSSAPDLSQSRIQSGYLGLVANGNFFSPHDAAIAIINTANGSTFASDTTYGIGTLYRAFSSDDVSGWWVGQTSLSLSTTGHPTPASGTPPSSGGTPQSIIQPLIITPTQLTLKNLNVVEHPKSVDRNLRLRYSGDGGYVWSDARDKDIGDTGEYQRNIIFQRLGQHRRFIAELTWTSPYFTALNGAFVEASPAKS